MKAELSAGSRKRSFELGLGGMWLEGDIWFWLQLGFWWVSLELWRS